MARLANGLLAVPLLMMLFQEVRLSFGLFAIGLPVWWLVWLGAFTVIGVSLYTVLNAANIPIRATWVVGFFLLLVVYSAEQGEQDAIEIVKGREGTRVVRLELTNDPLGLGDQEHMLAMQHGGKYYLVERQRPAPRDPTLYIVPESQVVVATIRRLSDDPAPSATPVATVQ